jgi:hypothetical protein
MNFIAAAILWHATEVDAFWIFVRLMEAYEIRDIYLPNLPGISKHCQIITLLLMEQNGRLHALFAENSIMTEHFLTSWIMGLFCNVIPVDEVGRFFDYFFQHGWIIFYKLVISILNRLEPSLQRKSACEIMLCLKPMYRSQQDWKRYLLSL